jgi:hypothetical protein
MKSLSDFVEKYGPTWFVFSHYAKGDFIFDEYRFDKTDSGSETRSIQLVCKHWGFENMPLVAGRVYPLSELDPFFVTVQEGTEVQAYYP